jgi:hypothetical protein
MASGGIPLSFAMIDYRLAGHKLGSTIVSAQRMRDGGSFPETSSLYRIYGRFELTYIPLVE